MNTIPRSFKPFHPLLAAAFGLAVAACDPEEVTTDQSSEALQIAPIETAEGAPPQDNHNCPDGFKEAGGRLCVDHTIRQPQRYLYATSDCRDSGGRVCSVEDFFYLYEYTNMDASYNPKQGWKKRWLGNYVGNDEALCGDQSITQNNDADQYDFDGECNAHEKHAYWCCTDERKGKWGGGDGDGGWDDDGGGWEDGDGGGWDDDGDGGGWDGK